jgi:hypothetical protein
VRGCVSSETPTPATKPIFSTTPLNSRSCSR